MTTQNELDTASKNFIECFEKETKKAKREEKRLNSEWQEIIY